MADERSEGPGGPVERLVERFLERLDAGEALSVEAFCAEVPEELREEVRERCRDVEFVRGALPTLAHGALVGEPPRELGDFRLLRRIGHGGMGIVYLARQLSLDREVAVKVLPPLTMTERQIARFRREARAAAKLSHKNIVPIHVVDEFDGTHFFAMEFVRGHALNEELDRQRRDPDAAAPGERTLPDFESPEWIPRVAGLVADVAAALQCAHAAGIVHRDVKPHNVLLDEQGAPHLVDFGLARDETQGTVTGSGDLAGTPYYMSPEQALARKNKVDHRTDVYSLGVVLYELLTRQRPFEGRTSQEILRSITAHEPASIRRANPRVPKDLETICLVAMAKEPADRYDTAAALEADLRRFLRGEPVAARAPSAWSRWRWRLARRPALAGGAAAGLLALTAGWTARLLTAAELGDDWPLVSVAVADWAPDSAGASVFLTPVAVDGSKGPSRSLGRLPVEGERVRPGRYRLVALGDGGAFAELDVHVDATLPERALTVGVRPQVHTDGMVLVERSSFLAGDPAEPERSTFAARRTELPDYWIDRATTTNAEYRAYWLATGRTAATPRHWPDPWDPALDDLPVTGLSLPDAERYALWVGKRVQTSLEWERAVRGTDGRRHPWGDEDRVPDGLPLGGPDPPPRDRTVAALLEWLLPARQESCPEWSGAVDGVWLSNVAEWTATPHVQGTREGLGVGPLTCMRGTAFPWPGPVPLGRGSMIHADMRQPWLGFRLARSARPTLIPDDCETGPERPREMTR